ncbi:hypothetical protein QBC37DRAFT_482895 [Rhypophila decipiens]|uniref:2EXR domain-containing protein n=1 Tax=Rhypophila decipiens TaxID=261697 RepID=A0AAN6Y6T4_9PEZI|nr:hypothetical protein QBC37DRAFT_482895 [Rhypophila decipiens]
MSHPRSEYFENPKNKKWPELYTLGYRMPVLDPNGLVCGHPVNRLFKSTRPGANTPRKTHTSILWSILHDHTSMGPYYQHLLKQYISNDDPGLVAQEAQERQEARFPKFMSLPLEIREMIWRLAIPRRTFFFEAATHFAFSDSHGMKNITLPVPMIAKSCSEARRVVMKLYRSVLLTQLAADERSRYRNQCRPGEFFLRELDLVLFNYECNFHEGDVETTMPSERWSNDIMLADTRKDMVGVIWANVEDVLYLSRMEDFELHPDPVEVWKWLLKAGGQRGKGGLERVYVQFSPVHILIPLYVRSEYGDLSCASYARVVREEIRFAVDLDDDEMLADLEILNSVDPGENFPRRWAKPACGWHAFLRHWRYCMNCKLRNKDPYMGDLGGTTPRFAGCFWWPNKGHCINCLRLLWKRREKARMLGFWLYLHWKSDFGGSKEMYDQAATADPEGPQAKQPYIHYREVFPQQGDALRINVAENPWMQEKLSQAPEFRAIVTVRLSVHVEGKRPPEMDNRTYPVRDVIRQHWHSLRRSPQYWEVVEGGFSRVRTVR